MNALLTACPLLALYLAGSADHCNNRSSDWPARERNSFSSSVPSLSRLAALNRSSTIFRYSSFDSVPSLSGSAVAKSVALKWPLSSRRSRVPSRSRSSYRTMSRLPSWLHRDQPSRHYRYQAASHAAGRGESRPAIEDRADRQSSQNSHASGHHMISPCDSAVAERLRPNRPTVTGSTRGLD